MKQIWLESEVFDDEEKIYYSNIQTNLTLKELRRYGKEQGWTIQCLGNRGFYLITNKVSLGWETYIL